MNIIKILLYIITIKVFPIINDLGRQIIKRTVIQFYFRKVLN